MGRNGEKTSTMEEVSRVNGKRKRKCVAFPYKIPKEGKELIASKKYFTCGKEGHRFDKCPQNKASGG